MAINPNELYGLQGRQVTDLADHIKDNEVAFKSFPNSVVTDGATQEFMDSILALDPKIGSAYLGTVELSDLPGGLMQEEVMVYVYNDYVLYCEVKSTDVAPYAWWCASYNYQGWRPINTDTTYTAGNGLTLNGTTFSVNTTVIQEKLSSTQMDAVNSGIDSTKVAQIASNTGHIASLDTALAGKQDALSSAQLDAVNSGIDSTKVAQIATNTADIATNAGDISALGARMTTAEGDIDTIEGKIPSAASSSNQLADKNFVNSSIASNTATFRGSYNLVSDLHLTTSATESQIATALASVISTAQNNDYAFVQIPVSDADPTTISRVDRYKYNGTAWEFEYSLNNSSFTASQWAAINSGITSGDVSKLAGIAAGAEVNVQSDWNETDTSSDAYIQNKPTIPAAQVNSDWNASSGVAEILNKPANLVQDASYVHTDNNFTSTLKDKLDGIESGAEVNEIDSISVNGTTVTPDANKNVDLTIDEGVKTLTVADYNYPTTGTKTHIALWSLPMGVYRTNNCPIKVRADSSDEDFTNDTILIVGEKENSNNIPIVLFKGGQPWAYTISTSGTTVNNKMQLRIRNNLTADTNTPWGYVPLSAYQGYLLNQNKADKIAFTGTDGTSAGAMGLVPAPATTDAGKFLKADGTWGAVSAGPTVVQTTGTSTTDVMSQNAVTCMVYPDFQYQPDRIVIGTNATGTGRYSTSVGDYAKGTGASSIAIGSRASAIGGNSIAMGSGSSSGDQSIVYSTSGAGIAIGYGARSGLGASGENIRGAVAIGPFSQTSATGQFDIGSTYPAYGYNSSNYRLLTGVYDPQSAHDAATKGYVDAVAPSITMTTTDPGEGASIGANEFIAVYSAS